MAKNLFKNLDMRLEEIKNEERVEGAAWGQRNGFAIATKGLDPAVCGYSASLLKNATSLQPDGVAPVVIIEGSGSSFFIKSDGEHNLTVKRRNIS